MFVYRLLSLSHEKRKYCPYVIERRWEGVLNGPWKVVRYFMHEDKAITFFNDLIEGKATEDGDRIIKQTQRSQDVR